MKPIGTLDKFVSSKINRLLIPYFVYGWLFMLPVKYLGNFYNAESVYQALQGFLSGQDSGHLWFLTALFWCMIIFVVIKKGIDRYSNSRYLLLLLAGIIQMTCAYLPFDVLGLKKGLGYIFWFALGYVFELGRQEHGLWNTKKTVFAYIVLTIIEIAAKNHVILNNFFVIACGSLWTFLLADILSRIFRKVSNKKIWKIVIRNLFYVYLLHDPMEYIVLRLFMGYNLLSSTTGCYLYTFTRTVIIFIISVIGGEIIRVLKKNANRLFADKAV